MCTPNNTHNVKDACRYACSLKACGKKDVEIEQALEQFGFNHHSATLMVDAINKKYTAYKNRESKKSLNNGTLLISVGVTIELLTYFFNPHNTGYPHLLSAVAFVAGILYLADGWYQHKVVSH